MPVYAACKARPACLLHPSVQEPSVLAAVTEGSLEHEVITSVKETMDKLAGGHFLPAINEDFQVDFDSLLPETPMRKGRNRRETPRRN
eukprot:38576-Pleurochrysis_carterae.AAC.4